MVKVSPVSDLLPQLLHDGVESPNGRFFAFKSYDGEVFLRYDRVTRQWATGPEISGSSQWRLSPDGRFLAFGRAQWIPRERSVWILPMDSSTGLPNGTARRINTSPGSSPAWSPDGKRIAYMVQDSGRFRLVTVPFNGGDETVMYEAPGSGGDVAWSPDGKNLFTSHTTAPWNRGTTTPPATAWIRVNLATRHADMVPISATAASRGPIRLLGYSPDGRYLAHFDAGLLAISSATTGKELQRLRLPPRVALTGWSRTVPGAISAIEHVVPSHVERVSVADGRIQSLTPIDSGVVGAVRSSPDGRRVAFTQQIDGAGRLHIASSDGSGLRAVGVRGDIDQTSWSPSGSHVAYSTRLPSVPGDAPAGIHIVDVASGTHRQVTRSTDGVAVPGNLGWRSDGQALRYIWRPAGASSSALEVREVTLRGTDRLLVSLGSAEGTAQFVNDTLMLLVKITGFDAFDLRNGALRGLYKGAMRPGVELGVSSDASRIAFVADSSGADIAQILSVKTGEVRRVPYSLKGELSTVYFHPDGRNLVALACLSCVTPYVEKWDILLVPINGDPPRVLTASQAAYKDFWTQQPTADGRYVYFKGEQSYNTRVVTLTFPKP